MVTNQPSGVASPRRVVYSALLGGYEKPAPRPVDTDGSTDFIFLTDTADIDPGAGWQVVLVEPHFPLDQVRSSRRLKILGHPAVNDYDQSLWLDNRIILKEGGLELFDLLDGADIVVPGHSYRGTVHDEFVEVIASGYDDPFAVRRMHSIAADCGVLDDEPLWTGMLLRNKGPAVQSAMERWFEYLLLTTRRDQLSVNAALAGTPQLRVRRLEIENEESRFHRWLHLKDMQRKRSVQMWRPPSRKKSLVAADLLRSRPYGRKLARLLMRWGLHVPTVY